jgi:hypothetical protein
LKKNFSTGVIGLFILMMCANGIFTGWYDHFFDPFDAVVEGVIVSAERNRFSRYGEYEIEYRYIVGGSEYRSDRVELIKRSDNTRSFLSRFYPGKPVSVFYDSANPSKSILVRGGLLLRDWVMLAFILLGSFFLYCVDRTQD